jgi:hypothetical protein
MKVDDCMKAAVTSKSVQVEQSRDYWRKMAHTGILD